MNFEIQSTFNSLKAPYILWLILATAANALFFGENLGINVVMMGVVLAAAFITFQREAMRHSLLWSLWLAGMVVMWLNPNWLTLVLSSCLLVMLMMKPLMPRAKWLFVAFGAVENAIFSAIECWNIQRLSFPVPKFKRMWVLRLSIIPLILIVIFGSLYSEGNVFFQLNWQHWQSIVGDFLASFWEKIAIERLLFQILMLVVLAGFVFQFPRPHIEAISMATPWLATKRAYKWDAMTRFLIRLKLLPKRHTTGLRQEYRIAIMALGLLNALLLVTNLSDLGHFLFEENIEAALLHAHVHRGTASLVVSLLVSALLVMYFFRGNLHFYHSIWLKRLAYVWLGQNALMVMLIALRNMQYIQYFGLTHKRLGVFLFLVLMLMGIVFVAYFLARKQNWPTVTKNSVYAVFISLLLCTVVNWDGFIVKYNLSGSTAVRCDFAYLKKLSWKSLPALIEQSQQTGLVQQKSALKELIEHQKKSYESQYQVATWLSYSHVSHQTQKSLKEHKKELSDAE